MKPPNSNSINRREVLAGGLTLAAGAGTRAAGRDPLRRENAWEGASDWQLTRVRINQGKWRTSLIKGCCSQQSYRAGEPVRICVRTEPARRFRL